MIIRLFNGMNVIVDRSEVASTDEAVDQLKCMLSDHEGMTNWRIEIEPAEDEE